MRLRSIKKLKSFIYFFIILNIVVSLVLINNKGDDAGPVIGTALAAAEDTPSKQADDAGNNGSDTAEGEDARPSAAEEAKLVLEGLEEKRIQMQKQEERIKAEQEKLKVLKQELEDKVAELEKTHALIQESLSKLEKKKTEKEKLREAADTKKIKQLVKVYANMKPKQAGKIINDMDIVIAEKIFLNMKGEAAGKILSYVKSSKAALISERLAMSVGRDEPAL